MAKKKKGHDADDEVAEFENEPSSLDDLSHAELCMLYKESTESIRFTKTQQWGTVGATLLLFGGMITIAHFAPPGSRLEGYLSGSTIVIACVAIFVLIIYQFWQYNEVRKITYMAKQFSSLLREVRSLKSASEGNFHRYTFLIFMISMVILGASVSVASIDKMIRQF